MTDSKLALICAAMFGFAALRGAEPVAAWTFDQGKNIDMETGTTEFDRTKSLRFEGMTSAGKERVFLHVDPKADPARFFVGSPRKRRSAPGRTGNIIFLPTDG